MSKSTYQQECCFTVADAGTCGSTSSLRRVLKAGNATKGHNIVGELIVGDQLTLKGRPELKLQSKTLQMQAKQLSIGVNALDLAVAANLLWKAQSLQAQAGTLNLTTNNANQNIRNLLTTNFGTHNYTNSGTLNQIHKRNHIHRVMDQHIREIRKNYSTQIAIDNTVNVGNEFTFNVAGQATRSANILSDNVTNQWVTNAGLAQVEGPNSQVAITPDKIAFTYGNNSIALQPSQTAPGRGEAFFNLNVQIQNGSFVFGSEIATVITNPNGYFISEATGVVTSDVPVYYDNALGRTGQITRIHGGAKPITVYGLAGGEVIVQPFATLYANKYGPGWYGWLAA